MFPDSSVSSPRRSRWLALLIARRAKITKRIGLQNKLGRDGRGVLTAVKTYAGPGPFEQHGHCDRRLLQRSKTQIPRIAPRLVSENSFLVLADDVAPRVVLQHETRLRLAGLGIDNRDLFLRRA